MSYDYESTTARECFKFATDGSLYKSKKPVYWCCSCQTALAEAEVEYSDDTSPSIICKIFIKRGSGAHCILNWPGNKWRL